MNFGRMIQTVKDLGLYENTVIWLISDNGPWELECQYAGTFVSLLCQGNSINTSFKILISSGKVSKSTNYSYISGQPGPFQGLWQKQKNGGTVLHNKYF